MKKLGLVVNEDNSHYFGLRSADKMDLPHLQAFVDQYAGTQVSHLFLCPNSMRTSYRSKVWDNIWDLGKQQIKGDIEEDAKFHHLWVDNAKLLDEKGLNPYVIWIDRCRQKGISPWISMRMNDTHCVDDETCFLHSRFWLEHPEYRRVPGSDWDWIGRSFDYGHKEVREYHMKLVREYLELFDMDGLELDWMRFAFHFKPGHEQEGSEILTEFMREVRELTKLWSGRRGHPIKLGVRVPSRPMAARGLGMDGVRWAKEGLIDLLVPTAFWATTDTDMPIELWRELLGSAAENITLAAGQEILLRPFPSPQQRFSDLESLRGFVAAMLDRGADQIYLYNYMDECTTIEVLTHYPQIINECGRLDTVLDKPRRHVITYPDTMPPGVAAPSILPADLKGKGPAQIRVYTGPKPTGGKAVIRAGLKENPGVDQTKPSARVNSQACKPMVDGENPQQFAETKRMIQFEIPLTAMQRGYNLVELFPDGEQPQQIGWLEIRIDPKA
jgi:hypothetical protein